MTCYPAPRAVHESVQHTGEISIHTSDFHAVLTLAEGDAQA